MYKLRDMFLAFKVRKHDEERVDAMIGAHLTSSEAPRLRSFIPHPTLTLEKRDNAARLETPWRRYITKNSAKRKY